MIHVLMIAPTLERGGLERQISIFLRYFDRKKLKITLALYYDKIEYEVPGDVEIIKLNKKYKYDFIFLFKLIRLISSYKYHLINSKSSGVNESVMLICGLLNKKKLILELRSSSFILMPYIRKMKYIFNIFNLPWTVICNSKKACEQVQKEFSAKVNIEFIGNGIDTDKFLRYESIKNTDAFCIGFIGRIDRLKNLEVLIKALAIINNANKIPIHFTWIGTKVDEVYFKELMVSIEESGLFDFFTYLGNKEDVEKYYNIFDLIILPSLLEGTPNSLLEAMSCGCVCLASKDANTDFFLSDEFAFETHNYVQLAEKIICITNLSKEDINKIGVDNRKFVLQNYSIPKMINKYSEIYVSIV